MDEKQKVVEQTLAQNESSEVKSETVESKVLATLKKYLFLFAIGCALLGLLSFIGNTVNIRTYDEDGGKVNNYLTLAGTLFQHENGVAFQAIMIVFWLVMPLIGIIFAALRNVNKNFSAAAMLVFLLSGILTFVSKELAGYFMGGSVHDTYFAAVWMPIMLFVASFIMLIDGYEKDQYSVKDLAESGMLIAMSLVLSFLKIAEMPTGGSVNLQMLPLFILALRRGPLKGFIGAGIVYGLIACLTDGYGLATLPFDYIVGFGSCAILGFFNKLILSKEQRGYNVKGEIFLFIGGALACFGRFIGGTVSSMALYGYAFVPAVVYNAPYIFISGGVAIVILMALYGPLAALNYRHPSSETAL